MREGWMEEVAIRRSSRGCQGTKSWECLKLLRADGLEKMIIRVVLGWGQGGGRSGRSGVAGRH